MKKLMKKKKRKGAVELEWAITHFFFLSLSHNTASCIVTQGLIGMAWETGLGAQQVCRGAQGRAVARHDTTW